MNSTIAFPLPAPSLKLTSPSAERWEFALREERRQLQEDQDALREREQNLRNYEARLRVLQDEIASGRTSTATPFLGSKPPFPLQAAGRTARGDQSALQSAWDKLHRARELLEAEQDHLRSDRHALRELDASLKAREDAVTMREARLAECEARLVSAPVAAPANTGTAEEHESAMARLTRMPLSMARSMLGGK